MRADRLRLVRGLVGLLLVTAPVTARAQGLTGYAQSQVQVFDQMSLQPDGTLKRTRIQRFTQTFEMQHFAMPRPDLRITRPRRLRGKELIRVIGIRPDFVSRLQRFRRRSSNALRWRPWIVVARSQRRQRRRHFNWFVAHDSTSTLRCPHRPHCQSSTPFVIPK